MKTIPLPAHAIGVIGAVIAMTSPASQTAFAAHPPAAPENTLAYANNAFACDLYAQLKDTKGNLFFSPFSVSSALAMAYAGAKGDTAAQMRKAMRFPKTPENVHEGFAALLKHFDDVQRDGSVQLSIANSLWPQKNAKAPLLENYLALVKQNYGVEITPVDYARAEPEARAMINRWVAEKTRDKIQNIIGSPLNPATRLVLANAVYFKGIWENKFSPESTQAKPFFIWNAPPIQSPLMSQTNHYLYGAQADAQFIELPYQGRDISMFVILPSGKTEADMTRLEKQLSPLQIELWRGKMETRKVLVCFPKFKITWGANSLVKPLKKLGMLDAFVFEKANFSGMNGNRDFFIDDILQKAFVDVKEEGTEAAAATVVITAAGSRIEPPPPVFRADHPFLFLIRDNATGSILFMGRVVNPAAQ